MTESAPTRIHLRCNRCNGRVVVHFVFCRSQDQEDDPTWTCPHCDAAHDLIAMGRVVAAEKDETIAGNPV